MKLSKKQQNDLETILYFRYPGTEKIPITEKDIEMFFEYSDRGKHKDKVKNYNLDGFSALVWGKKWRGIHIHEMYEPGILSGDMPYCVILGGHDNNKKWWQFWKSPHKPIPRAVVDFMKKEMFKGKDANLIEGVYQDLLK